MKFQWGEYFNADGLAIMDLLPDGHVDMIWTDPPYKVVAGGKTNAAKLGYGYSNSPLKDNNGKIFKHNDVKPDEMFHRFARVLKPGGHCYVMTNRLNLEKMLTAARKAGLSFGNFLPWLKDRKNPNRMFMIETEIVLLFYKKPFQKIDHCGWSQTLYVPTVKSKHRIHPTEKPVALPRFYIERSSKPGDIILDPFAGNGATCLAAGDLERRFLGIELDISYWYSGVGRLYAQSIA